MGLLKNIQGLQLKQPGIWIITETLDKLLKMKSFSKEDLGVLAAFSYENRKKEWLVSRILAEQMTGEKNIRIIYNEHNKPFLKGSAFHISLSHSHQLLTIIIDKNETGIDIERVKPKVILIKDKFMSGSELKEAGTDNLSEKLTLYWCVKESLYKYYGKKELTFKENLLVEPFAYSETGKIFARIHHPAMNKKFELYYESIKVDDQKYMLAYIVNEV